MGQKVFPTVMRLGFMESYLSNWFAKYGAYRVLLEEDNKIRIFLQNHPVNKKLGSSKIVISKILTKIEIIMYVAKPKAIKEFSNLAYLLKKELCTAKQIIIKFVKIRSMDAKLILRFISENIENRVRPRFLIRKLKKKLSKVVYKGICRGGKIKLSGRLRGAVFARSVGLIVGPVPTQTLCAKIDYAQGSALTKAGKIGIKVWISQL